MAASASAAEPGQDASIGEAAPPPPAADPATPSDEQAVIDYDPWQRFNRGTFALSMGLDRRLVAPVAHGYMRVVPSPIRDRVSAVVYNLGEPGTAINDLAQGHGKRAVRASSRFVLNSTIGVLGLFDVAAGMGLAPHDADFGQTLGRYGAQPGPYFYLPVMGPLNIRDGVGRVVDSLTDPVSLVAGGLTTDFGAARLGVTTVDARANADPAFRALDDATDPYATVRSAYAQHRAAFVRSSTGEVETLPDFGPPPPH
jgi:phospholipid-binding lipoprotein MlaA